MTVELTGVQRAILFKLAKSDPVTVTEIHQWWFAHLSRPTVKTAVDWLAFRGLARAVGVGDRNARTFTATYEGRAVFAEPDTEEVTR